MLVLRTKTPLSEVEVGSVLRRAFLALFGREPSREVLGVGWAQIALENAHGEAIWNNNFGNITTTGHLGEYYELETHEQIHHGIWKEVTMKYASHATPEDGAEAYWRLVTSSHYASAFSFFETGDAFAAAMELHRLGYFTATPEPIAASFAKLYEHFQSAVAPAIGLGPPPPAEPEPSEPAGSSGGSDVCGSADDVGGLEDETASEDAVATEDDGEEKENDDGKE